MEGRLTGLTVAVGAAGGGGYTRDDFEDGNGDHTGAYGGGGWVGERRERRFE